MFYDGSDIKYLLEKKGYSLSDVAIELDITPQTVHHVIWGIQSSKRVLDHIKNILNIKNEFKVSRTKKDVNVLVVK